MAAMRGPRSQVGSASWVAEERAFALQVAQAEADEFSYSVRNELDWLNEHMAGIFDENELNLAETFKTPGKLRGKTPHTSRKQNALEARAPLSDVFGASPERIQAFSSRVDPPDSSQPQANAARSPSSLGQHSSPKKAAPPPKQSALVPAVQDSGYFGSQDVAPVEILIDPILKDSEQAQLLPAAGQVTAIESLSNRPPHAVSAELVVESLQVDRTGEMAAVEEKPAETDQASGSRTLPKEQYRGDANFEAEPSVTDHPDNNPADMEQEVQTSHAQQASEDPRSPSDGSSPIRPMVRKSSLNFASLPAREPLTAGKNIGGRTSRTSHLDHVRTSYYNIPTGCKSLSSLVKTDLGGNGESDEMDIDGNVQATNDGQQNSVAVSHTRTYTQRLQDQINLLGKSQSGQSKLVSGAQPPKTTAPASPMPMRKPASQNTPGAFPNDDDDDWIEPPAIASATSGSRPALPKSHSIDVMEEIQGKDTIGHEEFVMSDHGNDGRNDGRSEHASVVQERADHVCELPLLPAQATLDPELQSLRNVVSGPDPSLRTVSGLSMDTPSKSPSRTFRDSPLKQVKNKLSSILKSSKGLLASSAAISAEGKSSVLSPSTACPGLHTTTSSESVASRPTVASRDMQEQAEYADGSPGRPVARRTRASIEREKEERRRDKEAKRMEAQNEKLEKAREKEREKALVFSREQERIAAMEKQLSSKNAAQNPMPKQTPKPIRSSPRKFKAAEDAQKVTEDDIETEDALASAPPPSAARSIRPNQFARGKETKRPVRPAKETKAKAKQAPTVIRVNTGSQSQYHSAGRLSTASHDPSGPASLQSQTRLVSKSSKALHAKPFTQGLRAPSSVSRPKTLDLMAKKELEEREAQRRRDIKTEMERKRAAAQEDQRKHEQWRRQEAERQRQQDHQHATSQNEGKVPTQKRAVLEKGKQTKPLPPAARSQASGTAATAGTQEKSTSTASSVSGEARPQSWATSTLHRSQDETSRPVNAGLSNTSKAGTKRALGPERSDEQLAKRAPSRGGPAYQSNEAKRRRTSDAFDDDAEPDQLRNIKGPLVRPSGGYKDVPPKPMYAYANAFHSATRDLFKATVTAQHNSQAKATHPLDMAQISAQISKGPIPFAPNTNAPGSAYKTPARPGAYNGAKSTAKSAPRSSPRFQNSESIELPEIQTDDEDDEDDEPNGRSVAAWADSPDLRRALMLQETMDPSQIFGPPAALDMEEVFHKSKDRWHKFRERTSSANWSGADRLTEEDVRKDLAARDKLRREGGWSYEMSREMM